LQQFEAQDRRRAAFVYPPIGTPTHDTRLTPPCCQCHPPRFAWTKFGASVREVGALPELVGKVAGCSCVLRYLARSFAHARLLKVCCETN
jgi:hypothetical protein